MLRQTLKYSTVILHERGAAELKTKAHDRNISITTQNPEHNKVKNKLIIKHLEP